MTMQTVTLIRPHTHAGKPRQIGDSILVSDDEKAWLESAGVIASDNPANAAETAKESDSAASKTARASTRTNQE